MSGGGLLHGLAAGLCGPLDGFSCLVWGGVLTRVSRLYGALNGSGRARQIGAGEGLEKPVSLVGAGQVQRTGGKFQITVLALHVAVRLGIEQQDFP